MVSPRNQSSTQNRRGTSFSFSPPWRWSATSSTTSCRSLSTSAADDIFADAGISDRKDLDSIERRCEGGISKFHSLLLRVSVESGVYLFARIC